MEEYRVGTGYVQVSVVEEEIQVERCGPPASRSGPTYTLKRYTAFMELTPRPEKANSMSIW